MFTEVTKTTMIRWAANSATEESADLTAIDKGTVQRRLKAALGAAAAAATLLSLLAFGGSGGSAPHARAAGFVPAAAGSYARAYQFGAQPFPNRRIVWRNIFKPNIAPALQPRFVQMVTGTDNANNPGINHFVVCLGNPACDWGPAPLVPAINRFPRPGLTSWAAFRRPDGSIWTLQVTPFGAFVQTYLWPKHLNGLLGFNAPSFGACLQSQKKKHGTFCYFFYMKSTGDRTGSF